MESVKYTNPALVSDITRDESAPRYGRNADGYGRKIPTEWRLRYAGRMRRVYCCQISNAGSVYIIDKGQWLFLDIDTECSLRESAS